MQFEYRSSTSIKKWFFRAARKCYWYHWFYVDTVLCCVLYSPKYSIYVQGPNISPLPIYICLFFVGINNSISVRRFGQTKSIVLVFGIKNQTEQLLVIDSCFALSKNSKYRSCQKMYYTFLRIYYKFIPDVKHYVIM